MGATTDYGPWNNHGDSNNVSVEATIADVVSGTDREWREHMEASGAFEKIAAAYRDAINEALPDEVVLAGNEFYGPRYSGKDLVDSGWPRDEDGRFDIAAIVDGIDLMKIIEAHDTDEDGYLAQPQPEIPKAVILRWAERRFQGDIAYLFTRWIDEMWNDWDPEEQTAGDILSGALVVWRGDDVGELPDEQGERE